jgi:putative ABC transport system permease protein
LALAWLGLQALLGAAPADLPRLESIGINGGVLAFTLGLSLITGLVFGAVPAWQLAWTDPSHALKEGSRGSSALGRSLRRGLVVAEVALAIVLLVGAGLMLRSFARLQHVDLGFRTDRLLSGRVSLWGPRYRDPAPRVDFFSRVVNGLEAQPGVEAAAAIGALFLSSTPNSTNFSIEGRPDFAPEEAVEVPTDAITPNYFKVMGVPIRRGRAFDDRDSATAETVAIINETMARQFWGDKDPLGQRIKYGQLASQAPWMTIVGVVGDTRRTGYDAPVRPEVYQPLAQRPDSSLLVLVRTAGDPRQASNLLRGQVQAADASIAVHAVQTVDEALHEMTAQRRLNTLLLSVFGVVAALLAAVGIYGVMAHAVAQRTRELGVRVALGASHASILRLVLVEGLSLAGIGLAIGLAAALALSRTMSTMLYDVSATDPTTFAAIAAAAVLVAMLATVVPAMRAIRVDPVTALRTE